MSSTRSPAPWMVPLDERILEILRSEGWSAPDYITRKVSLFASISRVQERCRMLARVEMIEPLTKQRDHYEIASRGIQYLDGRLDAGRLPRPSPSPRLLHRW